MGSYPTNDTLRRHHFGTGGWFGIEEKIVYFEEPGKVNTDVTLELVRQRGLSRRIRTIVLATTKGFTATKALEKF